MSDSGRSEQPAETDAPGWTADAEVERMAAEIGYWKNYAPGTWSSDDDAVLRDAAEVRRLYLATGLAVSACGHDPGSNWFDRTVCGEPCGKMHTRCRPCGAVLDGCVHEQAMPPAESLAQMRRDDGVVLVPRPARRGPDDEVEDVYACHGCGQPASRKANRCPNCEQVTGQELKAAPIGPGLLDPSRRRVYDRLHRAVHRHAFYDHDCQTTTCAAMHLVCSSEMAEVLAAAYERGRRDALTDPGGTG